jgi:hypothetical protein
MLVKVPVEVSAEAHRVCIGAARFPPQAIVRPRVYEAVRVGDKQEIPVVGVQQGQVVGQIFSKLVDGEEQGGGSDPLACVQNRVEENRALSRSVGKFHHSDRSSFVRSADFNYAGDVCMRRYNFINVGHYLQNQYSPKSLKSYRLYKRVRTTLSTSCVAFLLTFIQ